MGKLLIQEKQVVSPGDEIAEGLDFLPGSGCYREGDKIKAKILGLLRKKERLLSVVALAGVYIPKPGDGIIAVVSDMQATFWITNINSPYDAILQLSEGVSDYVDLSTTDISSFFDIGDVLYIKVLNVSHSKSVSLTMNHPRARKLIGGRILKITSSKVPRLIGKEGSMIELIKNATGCQIIVGQNGIVWIRGENEILAAKTIFMIEAEAHKGGLTDRITKFLNEENKGNPKKIGNSLSVHSSQSADENSTIEVNNEHKKAGKVVKAEDIQKEGGWATEENLGSRNLQNSENLGGELDG